MCGPQAKLLGMLVMTGSYMMVELVVGNLTNSMALVADSFHMMSDVIALIIAFISVRMSPKKWKRNTFGWARAEVVGALINAVFLYALCFSITVEAIKRFLVLEPIENPQLILLVGGIGLAINLVGMLLFGDVGHGHSHDDGGHGHSHDGEKGEHGHSHDGEKKDQGKQQPASGAQMNITGVFLHVMADALGSVVVLISASVIWLTDWQYKDYLDPVLSLVIVIIICISTYPLMRDSTLILLNSTPSHIDTLDLETRLISSVDAVRGVHELHVWQLVGRRIVASCHLEVEPLEKGMTSQEYHMVIGREVKSYFHQNGIHSTTIQLEYPSTNNRYGSCTVSCPTVDSSGLETGMMSVICMESTCCIDRPGKSGGLCNEGLDGDLDVMSKL